jgi:hypothetical protein
MCNLFFISFIKTLTASRLFSPLMDRFGKNEDSYKISSNNSHLSKIKFLIFTISNFFPNEFNISLIFKLKPLFFD